MFLNKHFDGMDDKKEDFVDAIAAYVENKATKSIFESSFDVVSDMMINGDLTTAGSIPLMFVLESIMVESRLIDSTDKPKEETEKSRSDAFAFLYSHNDLLLVIIYIYYGLVKSKSFKI